MRPCPVDCSHKRSWLRISVSSLWWTYMRQTTIYPQNHQGPMTFPCIHGVQQPTLFGHWEHFFNVSLTFVPSVGLVKTSFGMQSLSSEVLAQSFIPLRPFMGKLILLETADTGSLWMVITGWAKANCERDVLCSFCDGKVLRDTYWGYW